jgi:nucleotide-binding universal stress UspA family protein
VNPKTGNTILAGVDGSDRSADALALAMTLGMALQATPLVAYVHPYGDLRNVLSNTQYEDAVGELTDSVHSQMRRLAMPVDERAMTVLRDRSPARGLQQIAERRAASLVVVGSSHRSRWAACFLAGRPNGCSAALHAR